MHEKEPMLFSFTLIPIGAGDDLSEPVSNAVRTIADSGLDYQVTGSCTLIEGTWDQVMPVLESCVHELTERHPRVYADISVDFHRGSSDRLKGSVADIERLLERSLRSAP